MIDVATIKLVIWDLDDTFWKGTLSEGGVSPIERNIKLIKDLTDRGIVNSICSKNDNDQAITILNEWEINDLFVFKSIDWTPKGERIASLIKDMGLRAVNCLFLDDNVVNLNEALFYSKDLNVQEPNAIVELEDFCKKAPISDPSHKRLNQYHVLEEKQHAKAAAGDNLAFLYSSNTRVEIKNNCLDNADRLFELIHRTNQLNFTKNRCDREDFDKLLADETVNCGYVTVKDNFGDYGIVGFYAVKNNQCIHFLFSCRTIGQGVEQWVYSKLGCPKLDIVGEVVNDVKIAPAPAWINQDAEHSTRIKSKSKTNNNIIILKGACDLQILSTFLNSDNIVEEFSYIGKDSKHLVEHHNHSINILQYPFCSKEQQVQLLRDYPFNDAEMFETRLYDKDVSLVFLSTQIEPNLGLYRNNSTGVLFAFGEYLYPLTEKQNWNGYIDKTIFSSKNDFTLDWLSWFKEHHTFEGRMTPKMIIDNYKEILKKITPDAKLCLILGSEMPYLNNTQPAYKDRHLIYKDINTAVRDFAKHEDRVYVLDLNDYLHSQEDFLDNINHYQRYVYYNASLKANEIIEEVTGKKVRNKGKLFLFYLDSIRCLKDIIKKVINRR